MRVVSRSQAKELDAFAMNKRGIPGEFLMKNAGKAIAGLAFELTASALNPTVAVICGKGNNGGDGFAAAEYLKKWGREINVFSVGEESTIKGDAKHFYSRLIECGHIVKFNKRPPSGKSSYSIIIDAVLGTGVKGKIRPEITPWIRWINHQDSLIISADIPSGLDADTGSINPSCVLADKTVTMGFPKLGMLVHKGPEMSGAIVTADIGFPNLPNTLKGMQWSVFDDSKIMDLFPPLPINASKHSQGNVLIIAGSKGMTGAAVLASMAAMRSGAGLVKACVPESLNSIFEIKMTEVMTIPCDDQNTGFLLLDNFNSVMDALDWCDAAVIGPGVGTDSSTQALVKKVILSSNKPMVIDADALKPFFGNIRLFSEIKAPYIITPHCGELSKILKKDRLHLESNFPGSASRLSKEINGILVAKNAPTLCCNKKKGVINSSGNPGLATGGTGDVLSGILASLLAQGLEPFTAAKIGVFLHGKAADMCTKELGQRGMLATDVLHAIPKAISFYE